MTGELDNMILDAAQEEFNEVLPRLGLGSLFSSLSVISNQITMVMLQPGKKEGTTKYALDKNNESEKERELLFRAYEIIQQIRQILTGEELTYNLYITDNDEVKRVSIPGSQLSNFISLNKKELSINANAVKTAAEAVGEAFQKTWRDVMGEFRHPSRGKSRNSLYLAPIARVYQYGLLQANGKHSVFNKGHIIEALDAVSPESENWLEDFYSNLSLDSVSGFQGGDNAMRQVKANSARLMRYTSVKRALDSILSIEHILYSNPTQAKAEIKKLFYSSGAIKTANDQIDKTIDKFVDKLLTELKI